MPQAQASVEMPSYWARLPTPPFSSSRPIAHAAWQPARQRKLSMQRVFGCWEPYCTTDRFRFLKASIADFSALIKADLRMPDVFGIASSVVRHPDGHL